MSFGASFVSFLVSVGGKTEVSVGFLAYVFVVADGSLARLLSSRTFTDSNRK